MQCLTIEGMITNYPSTSHWTYHIFDPLIGLPLRVDKEGPATRELHHHSILHRESVLGQSCNLPAANLHGVSQYGYQVGPLGVGDAILTQLLLPEVGQLTPVLTLEEGEVGHCYMDIHITVGGCMCEDQQNYSLSNLWISVNYVMQTQVSQAEVTVQIMHVICYTQRPIKKVLYR